MNNNKLSICDQCGNEVEQGMNFCLNCGAKITSSESTKEDIKVDIPKKSWKIPIILTIILITFGILSFIALLTVKNIINSPEKLVNNFKISISEGNYVELEKIIKSTDTRLEVNEDTLKPTVNYFKSNPSKLSDICNSLNNSILLENQSYDMFYLQKEPGIQGLIGKYKIIANPVFFKVETSLDDTKIFLNKKEYDVLKKGQLKEIGPLMPGEYDVVTKYVGEYVSLENNEKKYITSTDSEVYSIFSDVRTVTLKTEYNTAKVIINGKNTNKTVEQLSNKISPVDNNTRVQLELDVDGKKFTTSEKIVGDKSNIEFERIKDISQYLAKKEYLEEFEKNLDNKVLTLMNEYSKGFQYAVNSRSFSYLTSTLYPGSRLYNIQQDYVNSSQVNRIYELFISLSTKNIIYDPETLTGTVDVEEVYGTSTNYNYVEKTYYYKYTFKYNETAKRFQLSDMVEN